jgi:hypothetical protein
MIVLIIIFALTISSSGPGSRQFTSKIYVLNFARTDVYFKHIMHCRIADCCIQVVTVSMDYVSRSDDRKTAIITTIFMQTELNGKTSSQGLLRHIIEEA